LPLYNAIAKRRDRIEHVLMRDERSAAYAADAYARASGTIGVCDATVGPGASNLVSALVEAYASSVPVLAIVSDIPRLWEHRRHLGSASQGFEQRRFLEPCVRWYGRIETRENLVEILHACVRIATSGRPGPVVLEVPADVFYGEADPEGFPASAEWARFPRLRAAPDPEAVERAAARLRRSRAPMIVAGGGALRANAGPDIVALAETMRCPVATTVSGKGVIPETHPLSVGVAGTFGIPMANTLLAESDCVTFIGSKAGQTVTLGWNVPRLDTPVVHIDVDPEELGRNYRETIALVADAQLGTQCLAEALRDTTVNSAWDLERIAGLRHEWWVGPVHYASAPSPGVVKPQDVVRVITKGMSDRDVLVTDASLASGWAASRWQVTVPGRRFFAPRGLAGLGWGLPAAIGVGTARRDLGHPGRVVCLAGDGGWAYSMAEVESAARLRLPIISVVLNNSSLAWIKHVAASRFGDEMVSEDFLDVSFAAAASALGATAERVNALDRFESAFLAASDDQTPRPWVIEVISCAVETPILQPPAGTSRSGY
jgi:acetolactate synthase-1/2/3 large subunit